MNTDEKLTLFNEASKKLSAADKMRLVLGIQKTPAPKSLGGDNRKKFLQNMDFTSDFMNTWSKKKKLPSERTALYRVYDVIDDLSPEIGGFLDGVSSESSQINLERQRKVWATSKNRKVQRRIDDLLQRKLKIDSWTSTIMRSMAKYGDEFAEILIDKDGVQGLYFGVPLTEIMRFETATGELLGFALRNQFDLRGNPEKWTPADLKSKISNPWQYVHWRIVKEHRYNASDPMPVLYGTSLLKRAIRPAYRLDMIYDLLLMFRASKSMDRFILKVDVTGQVPEEAYETLQQWRQWMSDMWYENRQSGEFDNIGNPLSVGEDIIWPVSENSASDVDVLQGNPNLYDAYDVDMMINQLYGGLNAPKGLFGYDDRVDLNRPYASQDIRFAKLCFQVQAAFLEGVRWIILTDLAVAQEELGLTDKQLLDPNLFMLHMVPPSAILHLHRLEALRDVLDAVRDFLDIAADMGFEGQMLLEWRVHVLRSVLGMTDFDIEEFAQQLEDEIKALKKGEEPDTPPESPPEPDGDEPPVETQDPSALDTMLQEGQLRNYYRTELPTLNEDFDEHMLKDRVVYPFDMLENEEDDEGDREEDSE